MTYIFVVFVKEKMDVIRFISDLPDLILLPADERLLVVGNRRVRAY